MKQEEEELRRPLITAERISDLTYSNMRYPVVDLKDLKVIDKSYHGNKYRGRYQGLYVLSSTNYH